ncbi:MAG: hypothetical protein PWQ31_1417, partial [Eubacteriales bacterium]|nr:hypothetical protein [Eubacteriales bacterium]
RTSQQPVNVLKHRRVYMPFDNPPYLLRSGTLRFVGTIFTVSGLCPVHLHTFLPGARSVAFRDEAMPATKEHGELTYFPAHHLVSSSPSWRAVRKGGVHSSLDTPYPAVNGLGG